MCGCCQAIKSATYRYLICVQVPLGFSWHFNMYCADFIENISFKNSAVILLITTASLLDKLQMDKSDSNCFISRRLVCRYSENSTDSSLVTVDGHICGTIMQLHAISIKTFLWLLYYNSASIGTLACKFVACNYSCCNIILCPASLSHMIKRLGTRLINSRRKAQAEGYCNCLAIFVRPSITILLY